MLKRLPWLSALRWWHILTLVCLMAAAASVAWHLVPRRAATGTVFATVNDRAVTMNDLLAEAKSSGVRTDQISAKGLEALLSRVVDRRLLLEAADTSGAKEEPVLRATARRASEMVFASAMAERLLGEPEPATDEEARRYIAANPLRFGGRQILVLDAVVADLRHAPSGMLDPSSSMSDLLLVLRAAKIPFERTTRRFDTAALPADLAAKMVQPSTGTLFRFPEGTKSLIGSVVARQDAVATPAEQMSAARQAAGQAMRDERLRASLAALRRKAKIRYTSRTPSL